MNDAICARVTVSLGQYLPTEQPVVMPAARTRLMLPSWVVPSSSVKKSVDVFGRSNIRARNEAICPRVTDSFGQNNVGEQPEVIPAL